MIRILIGATVMIAVATEAKGAEGFDQEVDVDVYVSGAHTVNSLTAARAQQTASRIMASAGVEIHWKLGAAPNSTGQAIKVGLVYEAAVPAGFQPGALAYSFPYSNGDRSIHVLYKRIVVGRKIDSTILGHVIAHEIVHVLQGVARHSATGVMRESWSEGDHRRMEAGPLPFESHDINLIRNGLRRRMRAMR